eukprot:CAMPEP_0185282474 /NCGR_PEP_ID=MMETSP1359-20130426/67297_1 /TAXON_ID=552665 /ORGANISM="Bigelowiella longifila, Strain CCMP242" /LENGTH=74 /DNA_ID=CAMNT_0027878029 /DNA_START=396 /DNA_END=620 /DNA_ORIENTATION=+
MWMRPATTNAAETQLQPADQSDEADDEENGDGENKHDSSCDAGVEDALCCDESEDGPLKRPPERASPDEIGVGI